MVENASEALEERVDAESMANTDYVMIQDKGKEEWLSVSE